MYIYIYTRDSDDYASIITALDSYDPDLSVGEWVHQWVSFDNKRMSGA